VLLTLARIVVTSKEPYCHGGYISLLAENNTASAINHPPSVGNTRHGGSCSGRPRQQERVLEEAPHGGGGGGGGG
jgi:hypothetical protein